LAIPLKGEDMKRFSVLFIAAAVALLVACEGDNPSGGTGTLPVVTGITVNESASQGVDVVIEWDALTEEVDGYYVYFSTSGSSWTQVGDVTGTTYTHTASSAGYYTVMAYLGDDTSSDYGTSDNDLPNVFTGYEIYDNYAPADYFSGFYFGLDGGEDGLAGTEPFASQKDVFAYDPNQNPLEIWLYSGDVDPWPQGSHTEITYMEAGGNPGAAPSSGYSTTMEILADDVLFLELADGYWVKMIVTDIEGPVGGSANGTGVAFNYEIQPINGLRLFTTNQ